MGRTNYLETNRLSDHFLVLLALISGKCCYMFSPKILQSLNINTYIFLVIGHSLSKLPVCHKIDLKLIVS